jgi:hypothetical protein
MVHVHAAQQFLLDELVVVKSFELIWKRSDLSIDASRNSEPQCE